MLYGWHSGNLELRRAGEETTLHGDFPYGKTAVLSDGGRGGGRPQKERIAPRAFAYRVEDPDKEIHLLSGHDFGMPLASKLTSTLQLRDSNRALTFDAIISPEMAQVSWVRDVLATITAGLAFGISPGFRIPPPRVVSPDDAEEIEQEPDDGTLDENGDPRRGAIIRTVKQALLYELSIVTRPAYKDSQIQKRNWTPGWKPFPPSDAGLHRVLNRWRA
jgi:Escherichia/Staphylococcus phage prohead protease